MRCPSVLGLRLGRGDQRQRDQGDGDVHPEDGPPGPFGQVAAENRSERGQAPGDAEEESKRLAPLAQRERVDDDGEGGWEHEGAAGTLHGAEADDPGLGVGPLRREAAHGGGPDEDDHTDHAHLGVAEDVREPAAQGEQRGQSDQVRVHDPLDPGRRQAQLALDVRHRDGDDRLIDERHGDREDHCGEHRVAALPSVATHDNLRVSSGRISGDAKPPGADCESLPCVVPAPASGRSGGRRVGGLLVAVDVGLPALEPHAHVEPVGDLAVGPRGEIDRARAPGAGPVERGLRRGQRRHRCPGSPRRRPRPRSTPARRSGS